MADNLTFSWDDEVEESSFELLPDGDYKFTVTKFERGWYEAKNDSKIPSCDQAIVELTIDWTNSRGEARTNKLTHKMKLARALQFVIYQFFESIGLRKKGDGSSKMPWNNIEGKSGICQVGHHEDSKGNSYNDIVKCYPAEDAPKVTKNDSAPAKSQFEL